MSTGKGNELATKSEQIEDAALAAITTFDDAVALVPHYQTADVAIGNGFSLIKEKAQFIGVPLMLVEWRFTDNDEGTFVSVTTVVRNEDGSVRKVIFNDGGTGIYQQLYDYTIKTGSTSGLLVKRGLRVSRYTYKDAKGKDQPAETFYLDTSA